MSFNVKANSTTHEIDEFTVLFEGNSNETITLSDSLANYKYVDICFSQSSNFKTTRVFNPNGVSAILDIVDYADSKLLFYTKMVLLSDTSISNKRYEKYTITDSTSWKPYGSDSNDIYIRKVVGYK